MSINQEIAKSIRSYPTLYNCRTDVLHQWFCVSGNGMHWKNGQLCNSYTESTLTLAQLIEDATDLIRKRECYNDPVLEARKRVDLARTITEVTFKYNHADDLALIGWESTLRGSVSPSEYPRSSIYPLCDYSCMSTVPDDVDPEYLAAVREMILEVFQSEPNRPRVSCYSEQQNILLHKDNLEFADKILQDLARRFGAKNTVSSLNEYRELRKTQMEKFKTFFSNLKNI